MYGEFSNFLQAKTLQKKLQKKWNKNCKMGEVHTCNLVSLNMAEIMREELESIVDTAVRMLDNTIDLTKAPTKESDKHICNIELLV